MIWPEALIERPVRGSKDNYASGWNACLEACQQAYKESQSEVMSVDIEEMRSLIDGCYEIVELFKPESPSQVEWKQRWLENARKHGASGE